MTLNKSIINKIIICILSFSLITACGKKEEYANDTDANVVDTENKETDDSLVIKAEDEDVPDLAFRFLDVTLSTAEATYSDYERENYECVEASSPLIELSDEDKELYKELAKTLENYNEANKKFIEEERERLKETYEFEAEYNGFYTAFVSESTPICLRADSRVLSISEFFYSYAGGVHGYYYAAGTAFDVETGKELKLSDVISDEDEFKNILADKLLNNYPDLFYDDPHTIIDERSISNKDDYLWSMDYEGVDIYFSPYDLGSFADGMQHIKVLYDERPDIFVSRYTERPDKYIIPLSSYEGNYADIDGDGKEDEIHVSNQGIEFEDYSESHVEISINDREYTSIQYDYSFNAFLVKLEDKSYIYLFHIVENDYPVLEIVSTDTLESVGAEWEFANYGLEHRYQADYDNDIYINGTKVILDPDNMRLYSRMNALSTYSGYRYYKVGNDGIPVSDNDFYTADSSFLLKTKTPCKCDEIDAEGNVISENVSIPADTMLRIIRSNEKECVDVQTSDYGYEEWSDEYWYTEEELDYTKGKFYRIYFDSEYHSCIDGVEIYDIFDGMMFAG